jgi:hypothetical protein
MPFTILIDPADIQRDKKSAETFLLAGGKRRVQGAEERGKPIREQVGKIITKIHTEEIRLL